MTFFNLEKSIKYFLTLTAIFFLVGCSSKHSSLVKKIPATYSYLSGDVEQAGYDHSYNSNIYISPASCQKIITTLAALKTIGSDYQYLTQLFSNRKNGKINNLAIKFSGDPALTSQKLINLLKPLANQRISGVLYLDASVFKTPEYSPNLMINDINTRYSTAVSSINLDKNLVKIKVTPTKIGELAKITSDCGDDVIKITSQIVTNDQESKLNLVKKLEDQIHLTGTVNLFEQEPIEINISVKNHDRYILDKINRILAEINLEAKVKIIRNDEINYNDYEILNEISSEKLIDIIKPALKISDNLVFDAIYLTIINNESSEAVTNWHQGDAIIKDIIFKHFALDIPDALIIDGSGLSRYNKVTSQSLMSLLKKGFYIDGFVQSLAAPGEDKSTLKDRLILPSQIRAKTGTLMGVSCLCGYKLDKNRPKAFVMMVNNFSSSGSNMTNLIDIFIRDNL